MWAYAVSCVWKHFSSIPSPQEENLCPLPIIPYLLSPPRSKQLLSLQISPLWNFKWMESYNMCDFWTGVFHISIMFSRFISVVACISTPFLFTVEQYFIVWIYHILFIPLFAGGHLGHFYLFSIINDAAINPSVQVFIWTYVFISHGYMPRGRISGSYGNCMFNPLRNYLTVFQSSCTILHVWAM